MTDTNASAATELVSFPLLLDEPTDIDFLSFDAVAGTAVEALLDSRLDPIALGLSGSWGSGKTSVLRLIAKELEGHADDRSRLVIQTDPWRYDPQLGAKESLIGEILSALASEIPEDGTGEKAKNLLRRLVKRVEWGKALQVAAKSAITVTLPSVDSLLGLVKPAEDPNEPEPITDMVQFRAEFQKLLESDGLAHLKNVIVLVDDLDRCLPPTVVETLETIRLFLSVPRMSFVIAADEERVAEAIAEHFPKTDGASTGEESPARLYLHKIVQTSVPVPALSDFDTEAYMVLLQIRSLVDAPRFSSIVGEVATARRASTPIESIRALSDDAFLTARNSATRIKQIVHEKTKGNPRRIKRFMNDLSVRLNIASRRGIELDAATIAKLMVLEQYFPDEFREVTGWLREQKLRSNMEALERRAGSSTTEEVVGDDEPKEVDAVEPTESTDAAVTGTQFSDQLVRWARLSPPLSKKDIAPYLVLAASFKSVFLAAENLPEGIRDIATQLLSRSPSEARRATDDMLKSLTVSEATQLVTHIGGVIIDEPQRQTAGVVALIRISRLHSVSVTAIVSALRRISPSDLKVGGLIQLQPADPREVFEQLESMASASGRTDLIEAIAAAKEGM
ncbi:MULTISPECIES: P-loop NTPase fold protein [unclassified Frondihabitans]|uniref:KAP family P-loop NTPase fold protein n=1 Tax=unclassified Frondihabitans TaxID=2626248 RepID=UPI000FA1FA58|nr:MULTISPECIES: P-loop NTPase fold protein [unclassified Frondihabitans]RPE76008.1 putative KAP-like P-loop ATPase [Frondihabitans sp. PhB153]RPF05715.1 putative KAP-like P-loop ATPase [Frondihabitans sp. PhB161]